MISQNRILPPSPRPPANEQLHDLNTIAQRLNVSIKMVRRLIRQGAYRR